MSYHPVSVLSSCCKIFKRFGYLVAKEQHGFLKSGTVSNLPEFINFVTRQKTVHVIYNDLPKTFNPNIFHSKISLLNFPFTIILWLTCFIGFFVPSSGVPMPYTVRYFSVLCPHLRALLYVDSHKLFASVSTALHFCSFEIQTRFSSSVVFVGQPDTKRQQITLDVWLA